MIYEIVLAEIIIINCLFIHVAILPDIKMYYRGIPSTTVQVQGKLGVKKILRQDLSHIGTMVLVA